MIRAVSLLGAFCWLAGANAHLAAWHKAMYCLNGNAPGVDYNSYAIVSPLYQLPFSGWWMHGFDGCNKYPPADGDFLDLPAGGSFKVEIASNRAKTSLSYDGRDTSAWPDGNSYPEDYNVPSCITSPNMHTQNQSHAAGTAFAISYQADINNVTPDNLVVFSVRHNTPWKREIHYDVPAAMPPCPEGGCTCAWGWVPNGCGQPNMYHTAFKCRVTGSTSNTPLASPKPPVWCEGNSDECTKGAKQMIYWNQNEGNNIVVSGYDQAGEAKSPGYNSKLGFNDGAQNDIFSKAVSSGSANRNVASPAAVSSAAVTTVAQPTHTPTSTTKSSTSSAASPAITIASTATTITAAAAEQVSNTTSTITSSNSVSTSHRGGKGKNRGSCGVHRGRREVAVRREQREIGLWHDGAGDVKEVEDATSTAPEVHARIEAHRRHHIRAGL